MDPRGGHITFNDDILLSSSVRLNPQTHVSQDWLSQSAKDKCCFVGLFVWRKSLSHAGGLSGCVALCFYSSKWAHFSIVFKSKFLLLLSVFLIILGFPYWFVWLQWSSLTDPLFGYFLIHRPGTYHFLEPTGSAAIPLCDFRQAPVFPFPSQASTGGCLPVSGSAFGPGVSDSIIAHPGNPKHDFWMYDGHRPWHHMALILGCCFLLI